MIIKNKFIKSITNRISTTLLITSTMAFSSHSAFGDTTAMFNLNYANYFDSVNLYTHKATYIDSNKNVKGIHIEIREIEN